MRKVFLVLCVVVLTGFAGAELIPGQMTTWSDFSFINSIAMSRDIVFFNTTEGILRYHRLQNKWFPPITVSDGLPEGPITRIAASYDDTQLYVETELGVQSYNFNHEWWYPEVEFPDELFTPSTPAVPMSRLFVPFGYSMTTNGYIADDRLRDFRITAMRDDEFQTIFGGTWGLGPLFIDNRDNETTVETYGLVQKRTDAVYIEGDSIWLAGNEGEFGVPDYQNRFGVTLADKELQTFKWIEPRYVNGFDSDIIYDIAGDDDNLYFAGQFGVSVLNRNDGSYFTLNQGKGLPRSEATALAVRNDSVWIGTTEGLALYRPSAQTINHVAPNLLGNLFITDLIIANDKLIIGSTRGAYYIDFTSKLTGSLKDPDGDLISEIRHLALYRNELLISTSYGLTSINLLTEKSSPIPHMSGPGGIYASAANERIYIGAYDQGLIIVTRGNNRRNIINVEDGLPSVDINALVPDGNYLWIGSAEGLTRFEWNHPDRID